MADKKLEEIVQRMVAAGESEENIALVIKEYGGTKAPAIKKPAGISPMEAAMSPEFAPGMTPGLDSVMSKAAELVNDMSPRAKGALVGSIAGSKAGIHGTLIGGVTGGILGEVVKQVHQHATGSEEAPKDTDEAMNRLTFGMAGSLAEEVAGLGVYKVGAKVLAPFGRRVTEEGKIAWQTLEKYMPKKSPPVTPAEMTESWGLDLAQNIAEKSWLGGKTMAKFKDITRPQATNALIDDMVHMFGQEADAAALGQLLSEAAQGNWKSYRKIFTDPLYNTVEKLTAPTIKKIPKTKLVDTGLLDETGSPVVKEVADGFVEKEVGGIKIPIKELKKAVAKQYREIKKLPDFGADSAGDNIVTGITKMDDNVQFGVANALRQRLRTFGDDLAVVNKNAPGIGVAKHLNKILDGSISKTLEASHKQAYETWRYANKLYKAGNKQFNNRFIRRLVRQADPDKGLDSPETVMKIVFKNQGITGIKRVKNAVSPIEWHQFKGWYIRELILKSMNKDKVVIGKTLNDRLFGATGMGKTAINEIFTKEEVKLLSNNAISLGVIQAKQASGTGGMLIQLLQPAAAFGVARGFYATGAAVLVTPEVIARMFLNKKIAQWMTSTAKLSPKTGLVVSNTARLAGFVDEIQQEMYEEGKRSN